MTNDHEVRSSRFPYDMSSWCAEKTANVGRDIAHLITLVDRTDLDYNTKENLRLHLSSAAGDISKLMSFSTGANWSVDDGRAIQSDGIQGYEEVAVKYGLLNKSADECTITSLQKFLDELSLLVGGDQYPNRTFIHELLRRSDVKHPIFQTASDAIEKVTMREMQWQDFQKLMLPGITAAQENIDFAARATAR